MSGLTLGCVPYVNAEPLVRPLLDDPPEGVRVVLADPPKLAQMQAAGEIDAGMLPTIEVLRMGLTPVPGIAIACGGQSESVRLHLRKPVERVKRVALDARSRTSNALCRVLLKRRWGLAPAVVEYNPAEVPPDRLTDVDAAVTIGDLSFRKSSLPWIDLGGAWVEETGLPFVFAVWAHKPGHPEAPTMTRILHDAKKAGIASVDSIATRAAPRLGISAGAVARYLTETMRYDLGGEEIEGLTLFGSWAEQDGLL